MQCIHSLKSDYHNCNIFVRDDLTMLVLPTFFSKAISRTGVVWNRIKEEGHDGFVRTSYQEQEISKVSCTIIQNKLKQFFNWLGDYSQSSEYVSVDNHHNLPEELLNFYVNDVLIIKQRKGQHSIDQHLMALRYYYNYLAMTGFTNGKDIRVKPKFKSFARQNTLTRQSVKYLSPDLCRLLYQNCDSLRDELLLRTGGELGLRSKENLGLLLEDFNIGNKKHPGFKSLFTQLRTDPEKMEFQYHLQGKFTKGSRGAGGKPRVLFIHRTLLVKFKRYFEQERPKSAENTLFLTAAYSYQGHPISHSSASRTFTKVKKRVIALQSLGKTTRSGQLLEEDHTYHTLRHSFGTDTFYDLCKQNRVAIDDVTPTSQIYLTVAKLMGHSAADKRAPETTKQYIRSCHIKIAFEGSNLDD